MNILNNITANRNRWITIVLCLLALVLVMKIPAFAAPTKANGFAAALRMQMKQQKHSEAQNANTSTAQAPANPNKTISSPDSSGDFLGEQRAKALHKALIGQWNMSEGGLTLTLTFDNPNKFHFGKVSGRFSVGHDDTLTLTAADGVSKKYLVSLVGPKLTLTTSGAGGMRTPMIFIRHPASFAWIFSWFQVGPRQLANKLWHVLTIIIIVIIAQLVLAGAKKLSYMAIFSDFFLFSAMYHKNPNRARTLHLLTLNLVKYIVYLSAIGMILAELGVNIGAYLVSLSVVGLAIGFGSQDLVKDMVTGFFVLFEGQYDVGDMVDVGGQTGLVSEIGLRMTRLRNYLGQTMVIPNRNVAVVGNYLKGAQTASIDLQLQDADNNSLQRARALILGVAEQVTNEFNGVMIKKPAAHVGGSGAGAYIRLELSIWPGQSWVIDQRLVPQIKETLAAGAFTIIGDRVTPFYHARQPVTVTRGWRWSGKHKNKN